MKKTFRAFRISSGLRQADVARYMGVSQVSVWQWEHGRNFPAIPKLKKLAELFDCEVTDLIAAMEGGENEGRRSAIPADPAGSGRAVRNQP